MTYFNDVQEWWPMIVLVKERDEAYDGRTAEFTDAEVARIEAAFIEFTTVQDLLRERFGYTD